MEIVQNDVKELAEAMQRCFEVARIEQAQADELQRAAAQRAAEDAGHLVVEFDGEHAVQRRELFFRDPRAGSREQVGRDAGFVEIAADHLGLSARAGQKAIDERDGNGGTGREHASITRTSRWSIANLTG
jgi:hypothetical protein